MLTIYVGARPRNYSIGVAPTDSMVERFDTFTLIVLGEVIVGVIAGSVKRVVGEWTSRTNTVLKVLSPLLEPRSLTLLRDLTYSS